MKILGIETSCDETAVCVVEAEGSLEKPSFKVLGDALYSQVKTHAEYGGVFPMMAKREHVKNLPTLLKKALGDAGMYHLLSETPHPSRRLDTLSVPPVAGEGASPSPVMEKEPGDEVLKKIDEILSREQDLIPAIKELVSTIEKPAIDYICVTAGPGLEPALWVGINFAQALGEAWNIPVIPTNHMEGHIVSPLLKQSHEIMFPALALLISGGHTELVLMKHWRSYEMIGQTRDDAVGEAFDKVARLLDLPYPGGPHVSRLAAQAREEGIVPSVKLPRPMIHSHDFDFSFSGIKTAVLYSLKKHLTPTLSVPGEGTSPSPVMEKGPGVEVSVYVKKEYALEFENAVTEVLVAKTRKALEHHSIKTLILGGGVVANTFIRNAFQKLAEEYADLELLIPDVKDSTDNALMIAAAGYLNILAGSTHQSIIKAQGNLKLNI